jgi:hypothetical protein
MTPRSTETDWYYDPRNLVPQWDPETQHMVYMHPAPPAVQAHGPTETRMGSTLASAQEMCRLENIALAQAAQRRRAWKEVSI